MPLGKKMKEAFVYYHEPGRGKLRVGEQILFKAKIPAAEASFRAACRAKLEA